MRADVIIKSYPGAVPTSDNHSETESVLGGQAITLF
jgi:hypothetical protein